MSKRKKAVAEVDPMNDVVNEWLAQRLIIADFLKELVPRMSQEHAEHNAAAIIARLSHAGFTIERTEPT